MLGRCRRIRNSPYWLFFVSMFINVGMWLERFIIIPVSLHRDFLPSSWGMYRGTIWDWATFIGTIGLFLSIFEMRTLVPDAKSGAKAGGETTEMPR